LTTAKDTEGKGSYTGEGGKGKGKGGGGGHHWDFFNCIFLKVGY